MANWFNRPLPMPKVKHSTFDLSNDYKTSMRIGFLTPVGVEECLPSDKITRHNTEVFMRFAPLKFPLMHRLKIHTSNFFVPFRIILGEDLYEEFLNGKKDIISVTITGPGPTAGVNPFVNTLLDYLGYDVNAATISGTTQGSWSSLVLVNPLPFLGYLCIVRDWYMDSNIQSGSIERIDNLIDNYRQCIIDGEATLDISAGMFDVFCGLFNVAYTKDYFNTARPQPQNGPQMYVLNRPFTMTTRDGSSHSNQPVYRREGVESVLGITADNYGSLDLNETTTVRDLWKKEMMQRYFEIDNSFGSRIREKLAGHFGVRYSDQRIQIPLYCGGSNSVAQISEVMSTSDTQTSEGGTGLGSYAGKAVGVSRHNSRHIYFEEHGYYITLLSLIPDNGYCHGQQRTFFKKNIFDFASPEFNNIGWQDVLNGELFMAEGGTGATDTWAYQPRYSEYRSHPSRCTGAFRSSAELAWHLNRNFASLPPLNENFLKVSDVNRIFSVQDITESYCPIYVDVYHHLKMSRPISYEPDSMHLY